MTAPTYNSGQPFKQYIPGGFSPGRIAHITGSFVPSASSIVVKLQCGPQGDPSNDVGLCLYGRHQESLLGCNSFTKTQGWGQEEARPTRALVGGSQFDITILCDPAQFKIAVNREHFSEYNHRFDPSLITYLNVVSGSNDIILSYVWVEGQPGQSLSDPSGFAPASHPHPDQYASSPAPQYAESHYGGNKGKGLLGMVSGAGAAVAGALGASHLLGSKGHNNGYPKPGYGPGGYPSGSYGYGQSNHKGGGLANQAMALGSGVLGGKALKKGLGGGKLLKYGLPLAGVGLGGYALSKGLSSSFDFSDDSDDDSGGCCDSD